MAIAGNSKDRGGSAAARPPRLLIVAMSFQPAIPWQDALPQCLPPLRRLLLG
jgi:hypothetical protein